MIEMHNIYPSLPPNSPPFIFLFCLSYHPMGKFKFLFPILGGSHLRYHEPERGPAAWNLRVRVREALGHPAESHQAHYQGTYELLNNKTIRFT